MQGQKNEITELTDFDYMYFAFKDLYCTRVVNVVGHIHSRTHSI